MDQVELLKEITKRLDEKSDLMRKDIKELDRKLDKYTERLVAVETQFGAVKWTLSATITVLAGAVSYLLSKIFDSSH